MRGHPPATRADLTLCRAVWQPERIELPRPTRILLIRLSSLGDVLFTLPAVNAVRDSFPAARLTYLVSSRCAPLLEGFAAVNETVVLDREGLRRASPRGWWRGTVGLATRLRRMHFDAAMDFHGFGETALLARLTGAPQRWGCLEGMKFRRHAYTRVIVRENQEHAIDGNLRLLREGGLPPTPFRNEFRLPPSREPRSEAWFREHGLSLATPTIFIQPFTSHRQKDWPLEKFLELARYWQQHQVQVIFGGGPADRERLAPAVAAEFPVSAGVDLLTTASLMQRSSVVVGGDTGMLHPAVAMGKRVVMLLLETMARGAPYGHPDWALMPRSGESLATLEVAEVVRATATALEETRRLG